MKSACRAGLEKTEGAGVAGAGVAGAGVAGAGVAGAGVAGAGVAGAGAGAGPAAGAGGTKLPMMFSTESARILGFDCPGLAMARFRISQSASAAEAKCPLSERQARARNTENNLLVIFEALCK